MASFAILRKMCGIWQGFKQRGIAPRSWGAAMDEVKRAFYAEVAVAYAQFRLCANGWKAEAVATKRYSSWAQTYPKRREIKLEGESDEPDVKRLKIDPAADETTSSISTTAAAEKTPDTDSDFPTGMPPSEPSNMASVRSSGLRVSMAPAASGSRPDSSESQVQTPPPVEESRIVKNPLASLRRGKGAVRNQSAKNKAASVTQDKVADIAADPGNKVAKVEAKAANTSDNLVADVGAKVPALVTVTGSRTSGPRLPVLVTAMGSWTSGPRFPVPVMVSGDKVAGVEAKVASTGDKAAGVEDEATNISNSPSKCDLPASVETSTSSSKKQGGTWQPRKMKTGRTLCAHRWLAQQYNEECKGLVVTNGWPSLGDRQWV
ncbi:hypothetical protein EV363DRAFT_1305860 [Boletus edulis]|nr:hypothetical protein EV363DRAFT_1305860 [Boletus edulis]